MSSTLIRWTCFESQGDLLEMTRPAPSIPLRRSASPNRTHVTAGIEPPPEDGPNDGLVPTSLSLSLSQIDGGSSFTAGKENPPTDRRGDGSRNDDR